MLSISSTMKSRNTLMLLRKTGDWYKMDESKSSL